MIVFLESMKGTGRLSLYNSLIQSEETKNFIICPRGLFETEYFVQDMRIAGAPIEPIAERLQEFTQFVLKNPDRFAFIFMFPPTKEELYEMVKASYSIEECHCYFDYMQRVLNTLDTARMNLMELRIDTAEHSNEDAVIQRVGKFLNDAFRTKKGDADVK